MLSTPRDKFLRSYVILLFCLAIILPTNVHAKDHLEITHGPYLVESGEDAITIIWFTNKECLSWVEYCGDTNLGTFPVWGGYPLIEKPVLMD